MAFTPHLHGQMTLNKSICDYASVPLSQKKKNNQLLQSIDQTLGNYKIEFSNLHIDGSNNCHL